MKKLNCVHVDTCVPCFWQGDNRPHVQISVWHGMRFSEIKKAILDEMRLGAIGGTQYGNLLSCDFLTNDKDIKFVESWYKKAFAAVNRLAPAIKGKRTTFRDLEKVTDSDNFDTVCAFFIFEEA
ncbi:hypothetical protein [Alishewanella phage vB_AspM_Slicko01]|nr:hypothetical protein [Alishewanella phage vB_AspM_Slicko01]